MSGRSDQEQTEIRARSGPLSDLLVLEFSTILAGPYATKFLAEMGAEVIRVEPLTGSRAREGRWNPATNHSKKSFAVDLKKPAAVSIVRSLAARADVLFENYRPGVMDRLGLGYDDLSGLNPGLVYCSLSGYGDRGPWRDIPGQDLLVEAVSGLMSLIGYNDRISVPAGTFPADAVSAMLSSLGIMFALHERQRSGRGQHVKTSLLAGLLALQPWEITDFLNTSRMPTRVGSGHYLVGPVYGAYRTTDGEVVIHGELMEVALALGCEDILDDRRYFGEGPASRLEPYRQDIRSSLQKRIETKTKDEVVQLLRNAGIWSMPVLSYPEALSQPQVLENDMLATYEDPSAGTVRTIGVAVKLERTPGSVQGPPPEIGEHTREILREKLGLGPEEVEVLVGGGAVR